MTRPLRGGGGGERAWPLRKKTFFEAREKKIPPKNVATKLEGGGGDKVLVAGPLKKNFIVFAASLAKYKVNIICQEISSRKRERIDLPKNI